MTRRRTGDARTAAQARGDWVPGAGVLAAAIGAGAVLGYTAGAGHPPLYLSLTVCVVIAGVAAVTWWRQRRPVEPQAEVATPTVDLSTLVVAPPKPPIDLARDRRTDAQKYVM